MNMLKPEAVKPAEQKPSDMTKPEAAPMTAHILKSEEPKPEEPTIEEPREQEVSALNLGEKKYIPKKLGLGEKIELCEEEDTNRVEPKGKIMYQRIGPRATLTLIEKPQSSDKSESIEKPKQSEENSQSVKIESILTLKPGEKTKLRENLERLEEWELQKKLEEFQKQKAYRWALSGGFRELESLLPHGTRRRRDRPSIITDSVAYIKDLQQDKQTLSEDLSVALTEVARLETVTTTDDTQQNESDAALRS
ncbi:hypothetical protein BGZ92_000890 [Podila epicladia]|nr:hypothetical protein BGZ92_000890 [Podila epicladia]